MLGSSSDDDAEESDGHLEELWQGKTRAQALGQERLFWDAGSATPLQQWSLVIGHAASLEDASSQLWRGLRTVKLGSTLQRTPNTSKTSRQHFLSRGQACDKHSTASSVGGSELEPESFQ